MTTFDTVVSVILGASFLYSIYKGMVREIFSLLALASGYYAAWMFRDSLAVHISKILTNQTGARIVSYVFIFFGTMILVAFIGKAVGRLMDSAGGLTFFNRVMGGVIGLVKGVAIVTIAMAPLELFPEYYRSVTGGSNFAPHLEKISKYMRQSAGVSTDLFNKMPSMPGMPSLPDMPGMAGVGEKLKDLKELEKLADTVKKKAKELADTEGKPQDEYSAEDIKKLEKVLKSVSKD